MPSVAAGCYHRNSRRERAMRPDALGGSLRDLAEGQHLIRRSRGRIVDPTAIVIDSVSAVSIGPIHVRSAQGAEQTVRRIARFRYKDSAIKFVAFRLVAVEISLADDQDNSAPTESATDVESASNQQNAVPGCGRPRINRQVSLDHLNDRISWRTIIR